MVRENLGEEGMKYFPWVFTIFMFISDAQSAGHDPAFVHRDQPHHRDLRLALPWCGSSSPIIGFMKHGVGFLRLFVPAGVPWWLMPIIVPIELISYFIRPISHSVRLFANMMAGHTMLKVFAGFVVGLGACSAAGRPSPSWWPSPASSSWSPSCRHSSSRC